MDFSIWQIYWEYRTARGHLVFWKSWPVVDLKKVLSVTKHGFVFWAQRKPNAKLEIYKAFQNGLTFLNRHNDSLDWLEFLDKSNSITENTVLPVIECFENLDRFPAIQPQRIFYRDS